MEKSESIVKLAEALSKAQGMIENASKDADNPFFHSSYADLASCWDVCRKPLSDNGLSIIQSPMVIEGQIRLQTILLHSSGEWISCEYPIEPMRQVKDKGWEASRDPQSMGSAVTYARRYCLCAMVGIASEDDDGEGAVGRPKTRDRGKVEVMGPEEKDIKAEMETEKKESEKKFSELHDRMTEIKNGFELAAWWKKHNSEIKSLMPECLQLLTDFKDSLKAKFGEGKDGTT